MTYPVRCTGCRRRFACAKTDAHPFRQAVYCSRLCAEDVQAHANMDREDLWDLLIALGWRTGAVAHRWGVAWSVVSRAVARRREGMPEKDPQPA